MFKFIYALPQSLKIKAMRSAAIGTKFDLDNIKTFQEVYMTIKNSCAVLKDIDDLVEEQGMGGLPAGFDSLDITHAISRNQQDMPMEQKPAILPFIRARAKNQPKRMTSQEIDKIIQHTINTFIVTFRSKERKHCGRMLNIRGLHRKAGDHKKA
ncbi:hypothetical protein B0J14DRAFT_294711 [Halenospora varia]|nr:hypothetical protein B0J14DRAFT_294711 [Halenospora varia]